MSLRTHKCVILESIVGKKRAKGEGRDLRDERACENKQVQHNKKIDGFLKSLNDALKQRTIFSSHTPSLQAPALPIIEQLLRLQRKQRKR